MKKKGKGKGKGCKVALLATLLLLTSCITDPNFKVYVAADRLGTEVTHMHYRQMLQATELSPEDKATHEARLQAKEKMLADAEKYLGVK